MRKNKLTALIVAVVMIMQTLCGFAVFAQEATVKTPFDTVEFDFFSALDMVPAGEYYAEDNMTRAQFAYIAARLYGWDGSEQGKSPFVDVANGSAYKDAITFLYNTKIVQGTGAMQFNPEQAITLIDATSIMIKILGYNTIAAAKYGEYPVSHIRMGDSLDLYDAMPSYGQNDALIMEDAFILLKNASIASVAVPTAFGDTNEYSFDSKNTLLYVYYDIVKSEGVVTDDGFSAINGATTLEPGAAIISGKKLSKSENGNTAKGLLGMYVDYYYVEGSNKFVYAQVQANTSDILTITYDMLVPNSNEFSLTNIVYYDANDKLKNAKISTTVDLIYNGGAYPGFATDDLKIESGYMILIDRDMDKVYDAVNITEYQDIMVKGFDTVNNTIYTEGKSIVLDDYIQYIVTDLDGVEMEASKLVKDTVASVIAAKDKSSIHIISCSKNVVQGAVDYAEVDEKKYSVNGAVYELSNQFLKNQESGLADSKDPEIGETYRFLMNADGKIAKAVHLASTSWYSGYCIGVGPDGYGLGASAKMRTMTPQGGLLDLYFGNKVSINGEPAITPEKLLDSPYLFAYEDDEKYPIRQPLKYKIDSWGKISALETPVDNTTEEKKAIYKLGFDLDNFSKDAYIQNSPYKADLVKALSGMYFLTDSTLIISDPYLKDPVSNAYESEDVEILPLSGLAHGEKGQTYIYEVDASYSVGMVVFGSKVETASSVNDYDNRTQSLFVVDKIMRKLDDEGKVVKVVAGVAGGSRVEYEEYEEGVIPENLKFGDVCAYAIQEQKLAAVKVIASLDTGDLYLDSDENFVDMSADKKEKALYNISYNNGDERDDKIHDNVWSTQYGPIYSVADKSFVLMLAKRNSTYYNIDPLFGYSTNGGNMKVTILDRKTKTVRPGTFGEVYTNVVPRSIIADEDGNGVIDKADYGVDNSTPRAFIYRRYSYAREMIFIK